MIKIKKLHPDAKIPNYAHPNDAGMDFYANETIEILPQETKLISTGIAMAIPNGYVGLLWDKSGIAAKHGLKTLGGVVDSSYRGEIRIIVHNLSQNSYVVEKGNKIAQLLIQPIEQRDLVETDNLDETKRGSDGFGSTGLH